MKTLLKFRDVDGFDTRLELSDSRNIVWITCHSPERHELGPPAFGKDGARRLAHVLLEFADDDDEPPNSANEMAEKHVKCATEIENKVGLAFTLGHGIIEILARHFPDARMVGKLREALRKYGDHTKGCDYGHHDARCVCGWNAIRFTLAESEPQQQDMERVSAAFQGESDG